MRALSPLIDFVKTDIAKLVRFAAVAAVTVPFGLALLLVFLEVFDLRPVVANVLSGSIAAVPNYLLNRYWVWNKRGANSVRSEIAPFWALTLLGGFASTLFVWIAERYTDLSIIFLAVNLFAYGIVWVLKFFVLEKYLFGSREVSEVAA